MEEPRIRPAHGADIPAVAGIVDDAYRHYIPRMGKPPGPMLEGYSALVPERAVWMIAEAGVWSS